jgi:hypothetical protein
LEEGDVEDKVRIEMEESDLDFWSVFQAMEKPALKDKLFFMDDKIKNYTLEKAEYPLTDTGSQYLDPVWRRKFGKIKPKLTGIDIMISLN